MEYGTTTGRPRRTGWFDAVAAKYAVTINGLGSIVLTKLDVLTGLKKIKVCTSYSHDGSKINNLPTDLNLLQECRPVYEEMPGWEDDITKFKNFKELPKNAQNYVKRIEEILHIPVSIVSVGPGRKQTIVLKDDAFF